MYPIDHNERHHPDFPGIQRWLSQARDVINKENELYRPEQGLFIEKTTMDEWDMNVHEQNGSQFIQKRLEQIRESARAKRRQIIK
jgi:hypothetical protein